MNFKYLFVFILYFVTIFSVIGYGKFFSDLFIKEKKLNFPATKIKKKLARNSSILPDTVIRNCQFTDSNNFTLVTDSMQQNQN